MDSSIPIEVWVGPSGSTAQGRVAQLALLADSLGVSIGSSIGKNGEYVSQALTQVVLPKKIEILQNNTLEWNEAIEAGLVQCNRVEIDELDKTLTEKEQLARCANPTLGDFLVNRDSFVQVIQTDDGLVITSYKRINRLNLVDQLMHTVASPPITYLLLVSGLALLLFEFFSIGVGIAGVLGAIPVSLSAYGLTILPFRSWALLLIILSILAFAIDIQTVVPSLDIDGSSNVHNRDNISVLRNECRNVLDTYVCRHCWIPSAHGKRNANHDQRKFATTQINR